MENKVTRNFFKKCIARELGFYVKYEYVDSLYEQYMSQDVDRTQFIKTWVNGIDWTYEKVKDLWGNATIDPDRMKDIASRRRAACLWDKLTSLARLINEADEWPLEANAIIASNGWIDDTDSDRGVCHTDGIKVELDDQGRAVVLSTISSVVSELKFRRWESGLTQQRVADIMGVAQQSVARIESGRISPSIDMVERYASALGLRIGIIDDK